jgi:hypothetical protein
MNHSEIVLAAVIAISLTAYYYRVTLALWYARRTAIALQRPNEAINNNFITANADLLNIA